MAEWYRTGTSESIWACEEMRRRWEPIMRATAVSEDRAKARDVQVAKVAIVPVASVGHAVRCDAVRCKCDRANVCSGVPGSEKGLCFSCYTAANWELDSASSGEHDVGVEVG
jgi:hypothetical protein